VQVAKTFGSVDLDFEWGALASTIGRSQWLYGIVGGIELSKVTKLMAELHGTSCTDSATVFSGEHRSRVSRWLCRTATVANARAAFEKEKKFAAIIGLR
jgi:hypothetical protein